MADKDSTEEQLKAELDKIEKELAAALDDGLTELRGINEETAALQRERDLDRETAWFRANAAVRPSTSLVTLGAFTPLVSVLFHTNPVAFMQTQELAGAVVGCLVGAYVLHRVGRGILEKDPVNEPLRFLIFAGALAAILIWAFASKAVHSIAASMTASSGKRRCLARPRTTEVSSKLQKQISRKDPNRLV
ncbi:hypothetical protein SAMN04488498_13618 [Mesorhizobium albiziae]|uniref:Uncharacterized protein n=1 Tax=Neomesorhizobium albiziae TaxID=335020 RepID=A0A1I4F4W6_9HYPH|nr:hypothetical protein [Mesorhizobium albiziae]GLS30834.1 hypothetical protein GCM10007937_25430 [Mesorhizobium albiziae]SFL12589.1 hypothetical protein SAMN04488498_13618 [Mesorhizobium albiziae]